MSSSAEQTGEADVLNPATRQRVTILPAAQAAADWWANRFNPDTPLRFDNGDPSVTGGLTMAHAIIIAKRTGYPDPQKVEVFRQTLAADLSVVIGSCARVFVGVDYGPDWTLSESLRHACIEEFSTLLPWKTSMWINADLVTVGLGYQAPPVQIYPQPEEAEPQADPTA